MNENVLENEPTEPADPTNEPVTILPGAPAQDSGGTDVVEARISAGAQLAAFREERGWTVEHVANQLNLAARQIDALEHDNYAALPGMVIVRGFIRAYAKVLKVDSVPILASIIDDSVAPRVLPPARSEMSASFSETQLLSDTRSRRLPTRGIAFIVALVAIAALAVFAGKRMGWLPATSDLLSSELNQELSRVTLQKTATVAPVEPAVAAPVVPQKIAEEKPAVDPQAATAIVTPPAVTPPVAAVAASAPPIDSKDALVIQARQDSWLEIKRADDNSIVASRILKANSSDAFEITAPVSVVIGNAAGVDVSLRGKPVDVLAGNTSNVARLNLK